jgi:acyl-CoA reductase-like NAD-dependent aldehyde dehydrogenase
MAPSVTNETNSVNEVNGANSEHHDLSWDTFYNVIDGKLESTKETRHGINPATGKPNPEVPVSTPEDVDRAVSAGQKAFKSWSRTSCAERKKAIMAFADGLAANRDGFAKMLVREQGKPVNSDPHPSAGK